MPLHYYWFAKIINSKLHLKGYGWETHIPVTCYRNSNAYNLIIDGNLFKKSQYFKSWETRYVAITPDGLSSYKQDTGFESFGIKRGTANELWTRFDTHESSLVIKILHNNRKT